MRTDTRGFIVALTAVLLLRLSITDQYLLYVKDAMRPWLLVCGVLLAGLAAIDMFGLLPRSHGHDHDHGDASAAALDPVLGAVDDDGHAHGPRILPWLLVLPFVVVFAIGPSPLGAFMAARQPAQSTTIGVSTSSSSPISGDVETGFSYPPLPAPVDGAVEIALDEFMSRASFDRDRSLAGTPVRITGFVTPAADGSTDRFELTRFTLSCCAADGVPVTIRAVGVDTVPAPDTWLAVEGVWVPHEGPDLPERHVLRVTSLTPIDAPVNPYL